jgi:hypothetical protein
MMDKNKPATHDSTPNAEWKEEIRRITDLHYVYAVLPHYKSHEANSLPKRDDVFRGESNKPTFCSF